MNEENLILEIENLNVSFVKNRLLFEKEEQTQILRDISFKLFKGMTLGIVGESGCGKTTLVRAIMQLIPYSGNILLMNENLRNLNSNKLRLYRKYMQMIFQHPLDSLNPRMTIAQIVEEPLKIFRKDLSKFDRIEKVKEMLSMVGISLLAINRYPHEFSGGQCQRIAIARSMILRPNVLICDEVTSALDVSIQGQIINLIVDLQKEFKFGILFISHNLGVVRIISHKVLVLYLGKIVEYGDRNVIYKNPMHPYTSMLISSVPMRNITNERKRTYTIARGEVASFYKIPKGCSFHPRCPFAIEKCFCEEPSLQFSEDKNHLSACHRCKESQLWKL